MAWMIRLGFVVDSEGEGELCYFTLKLEDCHTSKLNPAFTLLEGHPESNDGPESLQGQPMENESAAVGSPRSHRSNGSSGQQDRPTTSYKKRTSASAHQSEHAKQAPPSNPDEGGVTVLGEGSTMQG